MPIKTARESSTTSASRTPPPMSMFRSDTLFLPACYFVATPLEFFSPLTFARYTLGHLRRLLSHAMPSPSPSPLLLGITGTSFTPVEQSAPLLRPDEGGVEGTPCFGGRVGVTEGGSGSGRGSGSGSGSGTASGVTIRRVVVRRHGGGGGNRHAYHCHHHHHRCLQSKLPQ